MSTIHSIIFGMLNKGKSYYDPDHRPDYAARRKQEEKTAGNSPVPKGVEIKGDQAGGIQIEYVTWKENPADRIILYIHGGGFVSGSSRQSRNITGYAAKEMGSNVVSVDYRLAPEHPFPAGVEDCLAVYRSLLEKYSPEKIAFMGVSAGGNLVFATALMARDRGLPLPACIVAASPTLQYSRILQSYERNAQTDCMITNLSEEVRAEYFQTEEKNVVEDPYGAPLFGDFQGFPPVFLNASDSEVLLDDSVMMYRKLKKQGVKVKMSRRAGMMHGYLFLPMLPEAKRDLKAVTQFIGECFEREK